MKKLLSITLALVLVFSFAGCNNTDKKAEKPSDISSADKSKITIEETVLVDEADVKITAKSLTTDGLMGPEIKLFIENNSGKDLTFQCRHATVNGYMVDTIMSVDVVDGKAANDSLTLMTYSLEACGIDVLADLELSFHIFDSEWETYLDTDFIQLKTSASGNHTQTYDDSGDLAYDGNGIKIVVKGLTEDDSLLGPSIVVYLENTGDKNVTVQTKDVTVNGMMVEAVFSSEVVAGKRTVDTITFLESDIEENDITEIKDVELSFHVFDSEEWETIVDTESIKLSF